VAPAVIELDFRPNNEVFDRSGYEHLLGPGDGPDARSCVNGEPGNVVADSFDLAGV
jgi:hypothetical protein